MSGRGATARGGSVSSAPVMQGAANHDLRALPTELSVAISSFFLGGTA